MLQPLKPSLHLRLLLLLLSHCLHPNHHPLQYLCLRQEGAAVVTLSQLGILLMMTIIIYETAVNHVANVMPSTKGVMHNYLPLNHPIQFLMIHPLAPSQSILQYLMNMTFGMRMTMTSLGCQFQISNNSLRFQMEIQKF